jgi:hypothetical protein
MIQLRGNIYVWTQLLRHWKYDYLIFCLFNNIVIAPSDYISFYYLCYLL